MSRVFFALIVVGVAVLWAGSVLWSVPVIAVGVLIGAVGVIGDGYLGYAEDHDADLADRLAILDDPDWWDEPRPIWPHEAGAPE